MKYPRESASERQKIERGLSGAGWKGGGALFTRHRVSVLPGEEFWKLTAQPCERISSIELYTLKNGSDGNCNIYFTTI